MICLKTADLHLIVIRVTNWFRFYYITKKPKSHDFRITISKMCSSENIEDKQKQIERFGNENLNFENQSL